MIPSHNIRADLTLFCRVCSKLFSIEDPDPNRGHSNQILPPFILDLYIFLEYINKGSFGMVFKVALKIAPENEIFALKLFENDLKTVKVEVESIEREIKILEKLNHPNIIKFKTSLKSEDNTSIAILTEFAGDTLQNQFIKNQPFPMNTILSYSLQIIEALDYIHNHENMKLVHGDLKPANILVFNDIVKVIDFGVSKWIYNDTNTLRAFGTPKFFAPEIQDALQNNSIITFNTKIDIYSLGMILFRMTTYGVYPGDKLVAQKKNEIMVNEKMSVLLKGMLEKDPENRVDTKIIKETLQTIQKKENKKNGHISKILTNGDKYSGVWINQKKEGKGVLCIANGDKFEGSFLNDLFDGKGIFTYSNGDVYDGEWRKGKKYGQGSLKILNEHYSGLWIDDKKQGKGILTFGNGDKFEGSFLNDLYDGKGVLTYRNGDVYDGEWRKGNKDGQGSLKILNEHYEGSFLNDLFDVKGIFTYSNGDVYDGLWIDDKKQGNGILTFANGDRYEGTFLDDLFYGKGVLTYRNGDVYDGEWRKGKKDGQGSLKILNEHYSGLWIDDKKQGNGILTFANGDRYEGTFLDDLFYGKGNYYYQNGDIYEGNWLLGKKDGQGTFKKKNGECYDGLWKSDIKEGNGIHITFNGEEFKGSFTENNYNGYGTFTYKNGDVYEGHWCNGKMHGQGTLKFKNHQKYSDFKGSFKENKLGEGTITNNGGLISNGFFNQNRKFIVQKKNCRYFENSENRNSCHCNLI